jgi:hypothetical protein
MLRFISALLLSCAALLAAGPVAAKIDMVVMEARGVKLEQGQVIDGSEKLTLTDGQQVSLMTEDGTMVKVKGPFDKSPAPAAAATTPNVKLALQLLVTQENGRERAGVIRGGPALVVPPDPGLVDVSSNGLRCLDSGTSITFWRPDSRATQPLQVAPSDRSWKARADWEAGVDRLALPRTVPVRKRTTYVVKLGGKEEVTLTLITMMEAGCDGQAKALFAKAGLAAP